MIVSEPLRGAMGGSPWICQCWGFNGITTVVSFRNSPSSDHFEMIVAPHIDGIALRCSVRWWCNIYVAYMQNFDFLFEAQFLKGIVYEQLTGINELFANMKFPC